MDFYNACLSEADPWAAPISNQAQASPWSPSPVPGSTAGATTFSPPPTTNGTAGNVDDDFDILSSRTSPSKTQETTGGQALDPFDPLAGNFVVFLEVNSIFLIF